MRRARRIVQIVLLLAWLTPAVTVALNSDDYARSKSQLDRLRRTRRDPHGPGSVQIDVVAGVAMASLVAAVVIFATGPVRPDPTP